MGARWMIPPLSERMREMTWPEVKGVLVADTPELCRDALRIIENQKVVGVDVEAYGCNLKKEHPKGKAKAISIQFAGERGPAIFVPLWTVESINRDGTWEINPKGREHLLDVFVPWLEDKTPTKVLHNAKADRHFLANHDITMRGFLGDTLIMDYLYANGELRHGLKGVMRREFQEKGAVDYADVFKKPKLLKHPRKDPETGLTTRFGKAKYLPDLLEVVRTQAGVDLLINYAVKDPIFTVRLYLHLREKLREMKWVNQGDTVLDYYEYYERIARPYSDVLFEMEREGCPIDMKKLTSINERLDVDILEVEKKFFKSCVAEGVKPSYMEKLNLNAGAQVADLLYGQLEIKCEKLTNKGAPSTKKAALEAITAKKGRSKRSTRHADVVETLLKQRSLVTLRKMFIRPLMRFVPQYGGRVHSSFKQCGTRTSRLASATPNLENIPANKKDEVYQLRACFIAPPGYVVGDIDLKQIEVRFTAHFTKDPTLIKLLERGWDQHLVAMCMLSAEVREICGATYENELVTFQEEFPPDEAMGELVKKKLGKAEYDEIRRRAKVLNFSIIYGLGPRGYANQIGGGATKEDGEIAIKAYFKGFAGLQKGIQRVQRKCRKFGYVKSFLKRYMMIPEIFSEDWAEKSKAERQAFNFACQGSAADMIMLGMTLVHLHPKLRKWGVKMINQIHDEIVFLIPKGVVKRASKIINELVSHPYNHTEEAFGFKMSPLVVDTPADLGVSADWMGAKR